MKPIYCLKLTLLFLLPAIALNAQDCSNPYASFEFVPANTTFCEGPDGVNITVDITVDQNNDPACIQSMEVTWEEGVVESVANNYFGNLNHTYMFTDSAACALGSELVELEVKLRIVYVNGTPNTRSQTVLVKLLPRAKIATTGSHCVGEPVQFGLAQDCYVDDILWNFGGANDTSSLENPTFIYNTPGLKTVNVCVSNECGQKCESTQIFIRSKPVISGIATSPADPSGCQPLTVDFNPSVQGADSFEWSVSPSCSNCYTYVNGTTPDSLSPVITFVRDGDYTVSLIAHNECGNDTSSVVVHAYDIPGVTITPPPVGCQELDFTPNVTYSGTIESFNWSFPLGNPATSQDSIPLNVHYEVAPGQSVLLDTAVLTVTGPCGMQQIHKFPITVYGDVTVVFGNIPALCNGDGTFQIPVTPFPGGTFSSTTLGSALSPGGLLTLTGLSPDDYPVDYDFAPAGAPPGCTSAGSTTITVKASPALTLNVPAQLCESADPVTLSANQMPVIWSGPGITDTLNGVFDPGAAGAGFPQITGMYTDLSTGCSAGESASIEVVGTPALAVPDTVFSCAITGAVDLNELASPDFSPAGGNLTWSDPNGKVDPQTGAFNSDMVGFFPVSATYSVPPGCDSTVSFIVRVDTFVNAVILNAEPVLCQSTGSFQLQGSPSGGKWSGPGIDEMTGVINLSLVAPGPQPYTYTIRAGSPCESADMVMIRIESEGANAGPDLYVCSTEATVTLPGGTPEEGGYSGPFILEGVVQVSWLQPDMGYTYLYIAPALPPACNTDSMTLYIASPPDPGFSPDRDTACVGQTVTLTPVATGAVSFTVDWGDGTSGSDLTHIFEAPGDPVIQLTVTSQNPLIPGQTLCSAANSAQIHILQPAEAAQVGVMPGDTTGCGPLEILFTNQSQVENGRYTWDFGNGQTYSGYQPGTITFESGVEDTVYMVSLMIENGCDTLFETRKITVHPQPKAAFGISYMDPCSGAELEASVLSVGNPEENVFFTSIDPQGVPGFPDQKTVFRFYTGSEPDTVGIWLVSSNQCGVDTAYREVIVNPTDVVALIGLPDTTSICQGAATPFINYSTTGAPFSWAVSDGNTYLGDTIRINFPEAGDYEISLYAFGCGYDSAKVSIHVLELPTLEVDHDLFRCPGDPVDFSVLSNAESVLLWYGDGDSTDQKISSHLFDLPGIYFPAAAAVSVDGCTAAWQGSLTILMPPAAVIAAEDSLCAGEPVLFSSAGNQPNTTCIWDFGDSDTSDDCQEMHAYEDPGLFGVVLTVISQEGCRGTDTMPVYVRTKPDAAFAYTILEPCSPARVAFLSQSVGATGLEWSALGAVIGQAASFEQIFPNGGDIPVRLIATNEGICSDTAEQIVKVFQTPVIGLELDVQCEARDGTDLIVDTDPANFIVVTGPGYQQNGDFHEGLMTGNYGVHVQSPDGCEKDTSLFLLPVDELLLQVAPDTASVRLGDSIRLHATVNQTGVTFQWTPDIYLNDAAIADPVSTPFKSVLYALSATDDRGCQKTDTVRITVRIDRDSGLYIPDAFTPNNDNVNDIFYVRNSNPAVIRYESFQVFDKYDEKVFDAAEISGSSPATPENPVFGWDGQFRGRKAEMGEYRFVIGIRYIDDIVRYFTGTLHLIR